MGEFGITVFRKKQYRPIPHFEFRILPNLRPRPLRALAVFAVPP
jgi:hypothetical protein